MSSMTSLPLRGIIGYSNSRPGTGARYAGGFDFTGEPTTLTKISLPGFRATSLRVSLLPDMSTIV